MLSKFSALRLHRVGWISQGATTTIRQNSCALGVVVQWAWLCGERRTERVWTLKHLKSRASRRNLRMNRSTHDCMETFLLSFCLVFCLVDFFWFFFIIIQSKSLVQQKCSFLYATLIGYNVKLPSSVSPPSVPPSLSLSLSISLSLSLSVWHTLHNVHFLAGHWNLTKLNVSESGVRTYYILYIYIYMRI